MAVQRPRFSCVIIQLEREEGGDNMNTNEKRIASVIAEAINMLPDNKKEYLLGYAEGVVAMSICGNSSRVTKEHPDKANIPKQNQPSA